MGKKYICGNPANSGNGDHPTPNETVVAVLEQLDEVHCIGSNQFRFQVADFVKHFDAVGLDGFIFAPQVFGDFGDSLPVFGSGQLAGKLLVGNFVTAA